MAERVQGSFDYRAYPQTCTKPSQPRPPLRPDGGRGWARLRRLRALLPEQPKDRFSRLDSTTLSDVDDHVRVAWADKDAMLHGQPRDMSQAWEDEVPCPSWLD